MTIYINNNSLIKFSKKYFKQKYIKKNNFFIDLKFYNSLFTEIENNPKKNRKWLFRRLSKKRLLYNYRHLSNFFFDFNVSKLVKLDPLFNIFKRYAYFNFISQEYYNLTDYHLELLRRYLRKKLGKKVFIFCNLKPYLIVLKRPNQIRMGGGKGAKYSKLIYPLYPGCVFLKIRGCSIKFIKIAYKRLLKKMSFFFKLVNVSRL
jgi:ribosomal protein L16/L10AE